MKRLDAENYMKPKRKCNNEVKIQCAMWNEQIQGLTINSSSTPLPKQEQMWALDDEEMESSSKIGLKDVS